MRRLGVALLFCIATGSGADAGGTYDLFFRSGTLTAADGSPVAQPLGYEGRLLGPTATSGDEAYRVVIGPAADGNTGITLFEGGRERILGTYDTAVGNPVIMYFLETTLRQMAEISGGSPFYIRNRIKEALQGEALVEPVTLTFDGQAFPAMRATIRPFERDASRDRMGNFADLALSVTVSEAIPGWYGRLEAEAPAEGGEPFANVLSLVGAGPEEALQ